MVVNSSLKCRDAKNTPLPGKGLSFRNDTLPQAVAQKTAFPSLKQGQDSSTNLVHLAPPPSLFFFFSFGKYPTFQKFMATVEIHGAKTFILVIF